MTPEEIKERFPKGTIVRVRADRLNIWQAATANKMKDRLGEVTAHTFPNAKPIITFHAYGRKKEHRQPMDFPDRNLEVVTDKAQIAEWKKAIAEAADRKAKRLDGRTSRTS